ncbi:Hypothetical predicted protein [Cloeon dipterum]|uniref:Uncharacterized protein n=1 Tax=Cloeon dipterum TaxID=197152 RepID=A0A8S1DRM9_9INSE|nr:Hypothetical predicted protein [Cloeon dipterum]
MAYKYVKYSDTINLDLDDYIKNLKKEASISKMNVIDTFLKNLDDECVNLYYFNAKAVLYRLMRQKIKKNKKLDFSPLLAISKLYNEEPVIVLEVLQNFSSQLSKLFEFTINFPDENTAAPTKIEIAMLEGIGKMKNLYTLKIENFYFEYQELFELCNQLSALRVLDETMTNNFAASLPKLEYIGDPEFFTDMSTACFKYNLSEPSRLRCMSLKMNMETPFADDTFESFPNVRDICLRWDTVAIYRPMNKVNMTSLLKIHKLNCVKLINLSSSAYLEFFLTNFGKELKQLVVSPCALKDVRFAMISHCCPKLDELQIHCLFKLVDDTAWCFRSFSNLKVLDLEMMGSINDEPIGLPDILSAPNLEKVRLIDITKFCSLLDDREYSTAPTTLVSPTKRLIMSYVLMKSNVKPVEYEFMGNGAAALRADLDVMRKNGASAQKILDDCLILLSETRGKYSSDDIEMVLEHFITKETTKIDFDRIISSFPSESKVLNRGMRLLSPHSISICEFTMKAAQAGKSAKIDGSLLNQICKMENLRKLEISAVHLTIPELMKLCGQLVYLKDITAFKNNFSHLKTFSFTTIQSNEELTFEQELTRFCVMNLPNLEYLEDFGYLDTSKFGCKHQLRKPNSVMHLSLPLNEERAIRILSRLQSFKHLTIRLDSGYRLQPIKESKIDNLLKLKKLKCLQLMHLKSAAFLELLLMTYGKSLEQLIIQFVPDSVLEIRFVLLHSLCPKLKSLVLHDMPKLVHDAAWSLAFFLHLRELDLKQDFSNGSEPVRLSDILLAPQLVKVKLVGLALTYDQLQTTTRLVERRQILTKITHFTLEAHVKEKNGKYVQQVVVRFEHQNLERALLQFRPSAIVSIDVAYFA